MSKKNKKKKVFGNPAKQAEYEEKIKKGVDDLPNIPLPPFIPCGKCDGKAHKDTYENLDISQMDGIDIAFYGLCESCKAPTIAVSGTPEAIAIYKALAPEFF